MSFRAHVGKTRTRFRVVAKQILRSAQNDRVGALRMTGGSAHTLHIVQNDTVTFL